MKLFADSSAYAKRYILEYGSNRMDHLLRKASQLGLCTILVPEIVSALNRRKREKVLFPSDYRAIKSQLMEDLHDAVVLQLTSAVISHSVKLLETNVLRAMDALHVACALEWKTDLFVTADKRQLIAAQHAGLFTEYLGQPNTKPDQEE